MHDYRFENIITRIENNFQLTVENMWSSSTGILFPLRSITCKVAMIVWRNSCCSLTCVEGSMPAGISPKSLRPTNVNLLRQFWTGVTCWYIRLSPFRSSRCTHRSGEGKDYNQIFCVVPCLYLAGGEWEELIMSQYWGNKLSVHLPLDMLPLSYQYSWLEMRWREVWKRGGECEDTD